MFATNDTDGCDLLEKSYLCGISNNHNPGTPSAIPVVICLKSLTFVVSVTTFSLFWIRRPRCDLLEKSYLCGISNNLTRYLSSGCLVVICLKSLTFVVSVTTIDQR